MGKQSRRKQERQRERRAKLILVDDLVAAPPRFWGDMATRMLEGGLLHERMYSAQLHGARANMPDPPKYLDNLAVDTMINAEIVELLKEDE